MYTSSDDIILNINGKFIWKTNAKTEIKFKCSFHFPF